jgi:hypothetical protein
MKQIIKDSIRTLLRRFDIGITRFSTLEKLLQNANAKPRLSIIEEFFQDTDAKPDLDLLVTLHNEHARLLLRYYKRTKAQLRQDLFVLSQLNFKEHGFFVELGATNGIDWSNTYLMEKELGWTGILAEPAKCWHKELWKNRSCKIDTQLCLERF